MKMIYYVFLVTKGKEKKTKKRP